MKFYEGKRFRSKCTVTVNGQPLERRLDLLNHSPTGFEWGYGGSGPAQLALALLADAIGDDDAAVMLHHEFKWKVVANLPLHSWKLTSREIRKSVEALNSGAPLGTRKGNPYGRSLLHL